MWPRRCALLVHVAQADQALTMKPRVVVTRPQPEASRWAAELQQAGWPTVVLPLMAFSAPSDPSSLQVGRTHLHTYHASMWVSPQAVEAFFSDNRTTEANKPDGALQKLPMGSALRFWAPGPGTAKALQRAGVTLLQIDQPAADAQQFDSDALWSEVSGQVVPGFRLLVVHGEGQEEASEVYHPHAAKASVPARERLAQRVRAAGGVVDGCVAYRRGCPAWSASEHTLARQLLDEKAIWLFSSSEAIAHLAELMPGADWRQGVALATHPRIAQTASDLGLGCVETCRPALADVHAALCEARCDKSG